MKIVHQLALWFFDASLFFRRLLETLQIEKKGEFSHLCLVFFNFPSAGVF